MFKYEHLSNCIRGYITKKMKFSFKDFIRCDQIRTKLWIWSHLLKKSLWKTSFFVQCYLPLSCTSNRSIATALNCIGRLLLFTIISTATSASPDSTNCRLLDTKEKEECVHKPLRYLSVYTTMGGAFTYF